MQTTITQHAAVLCNLVSLCIHGSGNVAMSLRAASQGIRLPQLINHGTQLCHTISMGRSGRRRQIQSTGAIGQLLYRCH